MDTEALASIAHLAGPATFYGNEVRQLCRWCGYRIIDDDLSLIAFQVCDDAICNRHYGHQGDHNPETDPHPTWSGWVEVTGVNPKMFSTLEWDSDIAPENSCMRLPAMWTKELSHGH